MPRPENSTNVRFDTLRAGLAAVGALSPELAGELAARLFFRTPPRRAPRPAEADVLDRAIRSRLLLGETDGELAVWQWGEGPTVLLVHGWGGRAGQMHGFVAPLVRAGYRVVAFDGPGHGASTGRATSLPAFAAALERVASAHGPVHAAIGHSMGGAAAVLAMADGLALERAVLIGPPATPTTWFERFAAAMALPAEVKAAARRAAEQRAGVALAALDGEVLGRAVTAATLVVHDKDDREVALDDGARLAAAIPGGALLVTEGLGHRRILRHPAVIGAAVAFVDGADVAALAPPEPPVTLERAIDAELFDRERRWAS